MVKSTRAGWTFIGSTRLPDSYVFVGASEQSPALPPPSFDVTSAGERREKVHSNVCKRCYT